MSPFRLPKSVLSIVLSLLLFGLSACQSKEEIVSTKPQTKEIMFAGRKLIVNTTANQAPLDGSWAVTTPNNDQTLPYNWVIENMTNGNTYFRFESEHRCDYVKEIQIIAVPVGSATAKLFTNWNNLDGAVPETGSYNYRSQVDHCDGYHYEVPRVQVNPASFQSTLYRIEVRWRVYRFSTQQLSDWYSKYAYFGYGQRYMWY